MFFSALRLPEGTDENTANYAPELRDTTQHMLTILQGNYPVSLMEGDGIGPEISQSVKDIFAAAKVSFALPRCGNLGTLAS